MKLFTLVTHPTDGNFRIVEYEVIREAPKHWFVQMRNIPNKQAMEQTFKVRKDSPDYFYSPDDAVQSFIENQKRKISDAQRDIRRSKSEIEKIRDEIQI